MVVMWSCSCSYLLIASATVIFVVASIFPTRDFSVDEGDVGGDVGGEGRRVFRAGAEWVRISILQGRSHLIPPRPPHDSPQPLENNMTLQEYQRLKTVVRPRIPSLNFGTPLNSGLNI
jgi:hypothetical protein